MKLVILLVCLMNLSLSFATEAETDCSAKNEGRMQVNREVKSKVVAKVKGSQVQ